MPSRENTRNPHKLFMREFRLSLLFTKLQTEKKKSEVIQNLAESYRTEILGTRTTSTLKTSYLAEHKDDSLGKMTIAAAEMYENGTEFGDLVNKLDGLVLGELMEKAESLDSMTQIRLMRFMRRWSVPHDSLNKFYKKTGLNLGHMDVFEMESEGLQNGETIQEK